MKSFLTTLITLLSCAIFPALPASAASANDFYFTNAQFDYYLSKEPLQSSQSTTDGTALMKVKETLTAVFPSSDQNHGITRVIPYANQGGNNLTMSSADNLSITITRNGQPEPIDHIENNRHNNAFIVYIGDSDTYIHGQQTYVLEYTFTNVITDFTDYQELYWDTNGTGWSQTFQSLTANLHFEKGYGLSPVAPNNAWCYTGAQGSTNQSNCTISAISDGLSFTTTNLAPHENLTFVAKFPANTFIAVPQPIARSNTFAIVFFLFYALLCLAVITFFLYLYLHFALAKHKFYKNLLTPAQYTPHPDLTVAELSHTYLRSTKNLIPATILELAVAHKVELIQTGKRTYTVRILDPSALTPLQFKALQVLAGRNSLNFSPGEEIPVYRYHSDSPLRSLLIFDFGATLEDTLISRKLFIPKSESKKLNIASVIQAIAFVILIAILIFSFSLEECSAYFSLGDTYLTFPVIPFLTFLITLITCIVLNNLTTKYSRRTELGLEVSNYAAGLKDYIKLAEADRLQFLQSVEGADVTPSGLVKLYEKLLPYAAVFGLEKSWLRQLQTYYDQDPSLLPAWYIGTSTFSSQDFSSAMESLSSSMASMTSSSTSSGSDGGGSSGGGGGGGGGGGW